MSEPKTSPEHTRHQSLNRVSCSPHILDHVLPQQAPDARIRHRRLPAGRRPSKSGCHQRPFSRYKQAPPENDHVGVPESWTARGTSAGAENRTRTIVLEQRKNAALPDPSYDLDGDGLVSSHDYFLAKRLDRDQDGRLSPDERRDAVQALQSGFEEQFCWGVEMSGAQRGKRLLQVRGKVVDAENFGPVADTYPIHPLSLQKVPVTTLAELKAKRKADISYLIPAQKW